MKNSTGQITGSTPKGQRFFLVRYSLEWDRHGEVGPICIPLKGSAPLEQIAHEIETTGQVSEKTRNAWFAC